MKLALATNNTKKVEEIRQIFGGQFEVIGLDQVGSNVVMVEDCQTFSGNAIRKALAVARATGQLALADDSGLVVDFLNGAPKPESSARAS
jgi:XTP/dITP diphosphohydrolase